GIMTCASDVNTPEWDGRRGIYSSNCKSTGKNGRPSHHCVYWDKQAQQWKWTVVISKVAPVRKGICARQEIDDLKQMLAAREESDAKALHEKDQQLKAVGEGAAQATEELRTKGQALHEKDQQVEAAHREMEELKQALREKDQQLEAVGEAAHREMEELKQALREKDQQLEAVGETAAQAMDELRTKGQADREVDELKRVLAAREESDAKAHREIDELKRMLAARAEGVAQAFQERDQRVQDEPYEGPASFDISTPRSMKSPWADSPEEKRPDDAIVAENRQLHQRLSVAEEEKAIMMQNLRDHIKQLARENWDLKFKAGLIEDSTRSQSAKEAPLQESMNNPGTSSSSGVKLSALNHTVSLSDRRRHARNPRRELCRSTSGSERARPIAIEEYCDSDSDI
ncbi:unnamed protein product, partial [Durusdinium trenchii]